MNTQQNDQKPNSAKLPNDDLEHVYDGVKRDVNAVPLDMLQVHRIPNSEVTIPDGLHPHTAMLVVMFAGALAAKLKTAQDKYGYSDGWMDRSWMDECRTKLREHLQKGDPRDVAAYCAFLWHHGASTAIEQSNCPMTGGKCSPAKTVEGDSICVNCGEPSATVQALCPTPEQIEFAAIEHADCSGDVWAEMPEWERDQHRDKVRDILTHLGIAVSRRG